MNNDVLAVVPAPFRVWIATLFMIIAIFVVSQVAYEYRDEQLRLSGKAKPFPVALPENCSIFVFGSSLSKCALPATGTIEIPGASFSHKKYSVITQSSAQLFEFLSLMKHAIQKENSVIFIEAGMFLIKKSYKPVIFNQTLHRHWQRTHGYAKALYTRIISFFLQNIENAGTKNAFNWEAYGRSASKFRAKDLNELEEWLTIFKQAKENGVRVFILDLSRSKRADSYLKPEFLHEFSNLMHTVEKRSGVEFIPFPYAMDFPDKYKDSVHMNDAGKAIYTEWFEKLLAEKIFVTGQE
ncbi:MAG: hypothetical protein KKB51_09355 [Candidatus Riflebacteria bacterium]|nr:hypothetical protein [Candidatus Riflebacteria bacterium]